MSEQLPLDFVRAPEQPISVEIKMADGIFVKSMHFGSHGSYVPTHSHKYDHLSMLAYGSIRVWTDGEYVGDFFAPHGLTIRAGIKHVFQSLEPDTIVYCIHNLKDAEEVEVFAEHLLPGTE